MIMLFSISVNELMEQLSPRAVEGNIVVFGPILQFLPMITGPTIYDPDLTTELSPMATSPIMTAPFSIEPETFMSSILPSNTEFAFNRSHECTASIHVLRVVIFVTLAPFSIIFWIVSVIAYSPISEMGVFSISLKIDDENMYIPVFTRWLILSLGFSNICVTFPFSINNTPYPVI